MKHKIDFEYLCDQTLDQNNFCGKCRYHVVDLSQHTATEIESILSEPDVCVTATYVDDVLVVKPTVSRWTRLAANVSLFAMLGCEVAPVPRAQTPVPTPEALEVQEKAASRVLRAYNIAVFEHVENEPVERVTFDDALSRIERLQDARNKRHSYREKEGVSIRPVSLLDGDIEDAQKEATAVLDSGELELIQRKRRRTLRGKPKINPTGRPMKITAD